MGFHHHSADLAAAEQILAVRPLWCDLKTARAVMGLPSRTILHAGPPVSDPGRLVRPVLNSVITAALFEGWAQTPEEAEELVLSKKIQLAAAQDHHAVVPLADVLSPSMIVQVIVDRADPNCVAYSPINGGKDPVLRHGIRSNEVLNRLRWINGEFAATLARALHKPISLLEFADTGLAAGDDCHGRTAAATKELSKRLSPMLGDDASATRSREFLETSPSFFLNLWMAATKCMLRVAEGAPKASLVTTIGSNGAMFGLQLAGLPGRWFITDATTPVVPVAVQTVALRGLGAIGDSPVVDAFGLGAMALAFAPETAKLLTTVLESDAVDLPRKLLVAEHPGFVTTHPLTILAARAVVAQRVTPIVSLGVLDKMGIEGRIAGGVYRPPIALFKQACAALELA